MGQFAHYRAREAQTERVRRKEKIVSRPERLLAFSFDPRRAAKDPQRPQQPARSAFAAGVPMKRLGRSEEIADAIVYLGSDTASYLTGQIIGVNGGKTAS